MHPPERRTGVLHRTAIPGFSRTGARPSAAGVRSAARDLRGVLGRGLRVVADVIGDDQPPGYDVPLTGSATQCLVCGHEGVRRRRLTHVGRNDLSCRVRVCGQCGFVHIVRTGIDKYRKLDTIGELSLGPRAGTLGRPGREFFMGQMAARMLGRKGMDVLVAGAGGSMDNHHLARLDSVRHVAVGDIMALRDDAQFNDAEFIDMNQPAQRTFDLVLASEVVEHFRAPRKDFHRLLEFVGPDGLLVCGTNLHVGYPLERCRYVFYPDHTAFYSPRSLRVVARAEGYHLDFRAPMQGPKRYLFLSRSAAVMESVSHYFGLVAQPPVEVVRPLGRPRRRVASIG